MNILFLCLGLCLLGASAKPQADSLVASTEPSTSGSGKENGDAQYTVPKIYKMSIHSKVANRFANTTITSKVRNLGKTAQEATFAVVLPESAYITGFIMEINNKNYTAYVQEKEEAKATYDKAVSSGLGAAHVAVSARDSNRFTVSVNVEPATKATFYLAYEELLKRKDGYEIVINIHPTQPVPNLEVQIDINESNPIRYVKAPPIRSGNDIRKSEGDLDPRAKIIKINETFTTVTFNPNEERQKQLAHALGTKENEGLAGQFVVQYDVERDASGGEVLLKDGYFVHFFSPDEVQLLPKYVIFVLDTSGSMYDRKIIQLKEAMQSILSELKTDDLFSLIEFNTKVKVWNVVKQEESTEYPQTDNVWRYDWENHTYDDIKFPEGFAPTPENIQKAKSIVETFTPNGGTNIYEALKIALHLYDLKKKTSEQFNKQPLIVFLTDGDPTVGETDINQIVSKLSEKNLQSVPIFSLSFGDGADRNFLRKLSLHNSAFSRHIYEAADASLQLEDFYKQISSPLLKNIKFKYTQDVKNLTKTDYPVFFKGGEYIVAGFTDKNLNEEVPHVEGWGINGPIILKPKVKQSFGELERLWAYLSIQQLLEAKEIAKNKKVYEKKALDLALKYSFVTPVSSLVVVKPNATSSVDTEAADKQPGYYGSFSPSSAQAIPKSGYTMFTSSAAGIVPLSASGPFYQSAFIIPQSPGGFADVSGIPASPGLGSALPYNPHHVQLPSAQFESDVDSLSETIIPNTTYNIISNKLRELLNHLPWLNSILVGEQITIKGTQYKLGIDETVDETTQCLNAPNNATAGHCKLLHNCESVTKNNVLTTVVVYQQHFCHIGEYAGVCCPVVP